jgi:MFS family permease
VSSLSVPGHIRVTWPLWRILLPIGVGTALSLMGDTALYAVLPTHVVDAGVPLASVGLLLSANRWIRLLLNGPAGLAYDHWPRRWFFIPALFLGTLSTVLYGWTRGFWPLLVGRLLWGIAWSGIWVGGNTIILDVATPEDRGRLTGFYQLSFYLGSSLGFPIGGLLTDWLGFHQAMMVAAAVTGAGAVVALLLLPETRPARSLLSAAGPGAPAAHEPARPGPQAPAAPDAPSARWRKWPALSSPAASAMLLYAANRFVIAGVVSASLGLLIQQRWGALYLPNGVLIGVATLTGFLLGSNTLISMFSAPLAGHWSDRRHNRWQIVALGLFPGVLGMLFLAFGQPVTIVGGILLAAIAGGSNQSLATTVLGDVTASGRRGRALGWMHTFGDLSSAIGPPLVYSILPMIGLPGIYLACAGLLGALILWTYRLGRGQARLPPRA